MPDLMELADSGYCAIDIEGCTRDPTSSVEIRNAVVFSHDEACFLSIRSVENVITKNVDIVRGPPGLFALIRFWARARIFYAARRIVAKGLRL